jgi:hypothetical protein
VWERHAGIATAGDGISLLIKGVAQGNLHQSGNVALHMYTAAAVVAAGLIDRMLASMRPSLLTALLVLVVGGALMFGGAGAGNVLTTLGGRLRAESALSGGWAESALSLSQLHRLLLAQCQLYSHSAVCMLCVRGGGAMCGEFRRNSSSSCPGAQGTLPRQAGSLPVKYCSTVSAVAYDDRTLRCTTPRDLQALLRYCCTRHTCCTAGAVASGRRLRMQRLISRRLGMKRLGTLMILVNKNNLPRLATWRGR